MRAETPGNGPQFPPRTRVRFRPISKKKNLLIYKSSRTKQRTALDVRAREGGGRGGGGGGKEGGLYSYHGNQTSTD